ncbi:MAG: SMP-30/gluconolactonase/LRE family protein [Phycisphaerae bacterium]|nr:SMP-30/gluconolactonase/LRE family protein [Phycisphaerae bacterium]
MRVTKTINRTCLMLVCVVLLATPALAEGLKKPALFMTLPDQCNTPDGMTLAPDGNIILSCPNYNNDKFPGILMMITPGNELKEYFRLPMHPGTGKVGPMGLDFGPDGNLYVADNQCFNTSLYKSRLLRVRVENGKPVGCEVAVYGFKVANAVIWRGDYVYVSDSVQNVTWPASESHFPSCIYRIHVKEFAEKPLELQPAGLDPHCIARVYTRNRQLAFGADGLTFDDEGNLYCGNFGDGLLHKISFDADGKVVSNTVLASGGPMKCCDGLFYDSKRKVIFVSDSVMNAVQMVDLKGNITTLAQNGDTDGADGSIDQVCEVLVRGDELIIVNMDFPFPGLTNTKHEKPYTLSVVKLDR